MAKYQDFSDFLLRQADEFGEYFTVKATGASGMSHRGLARLIGKNHSSVTRWAKRTREADLAQNDLPECFKPFAGQALTLAQYDDPEGRDILNDGFCHAAVKYFSIEAPAEQRTSEAVQASDLIGKVGMRKFIHLKTGWLPSEHQEEFEVVFQRHTQRFKVRMALKDIFRVELMEAIKAWQKKYKKSRRIFWEAQDAVNKRLQGLKSQEIKSHNGLAKSSLIRDYFEAEPLIDYSAINRLAANLINQEDMHPIDAVNKACDLYLKPEFQPAPVQIIENLYRADKRLKAVKIKHDKRLESRQKAKSLSNDHQQLDLFSA